MRHLTRKQGRKGQGLVEYILIVFLMGITCITVVKKLSTSTQTGFTNASTSLDKEFGSSGGPGGGRSGGGRKAR